MSRQYRTSASSRERNRIHARKTRQRKKEQMHTLQSRADDLKEEQLRLKQIINEKNTANILVGLFSTASDPQAKATEDPRVEELLRRTAEDIPDSSTIPELPALILPGQHASKKMKASSEDKGQVSSDDIDYGLLGKDRSKCSPEELDRIRRERNRMHAKRTRDRKRLFMEEMAELCRHLDEENDLLRAHLAEIDPDHEELHKRDTAVEPESEPESLRSTPTLLSPKLLPLAPKVGVEEIRVNPSSSPARSKMGATFDQIGTLLQAATSFEGVVGSGGKRRFSSISSDDSSDDSHDDGDYSSSRRAIAKRKNLSSTIQKAIATVGC